MKLKKRSIKEWEEWLRIAINQNPDNLKDDEKYVLQAFLELIEKHNHLIGKILILKTYGKSKL